MKRMDISPTDETLITTLEEDSLGRNADLIDFAAILSSIEGGFSLFLDAGWGEGKTFFVRQIKLLLDAANSLIPSGEGLACLTSGVGQLVAYSELDSFLPVYYNAWENDYWDDPLPTIAAAIAKAGNASFACRNDTSTSQKIVAAVECILKLSGLSGIAELENGFRGKDLIEQFGDREALRNAVAALVDEVLPERANTMLLIVDELDRCKPTFSIRVLEELKFLFELDNVVILYSLNCSQLVHTVEGLYGSGFDAHRYLSRFYDLKVTLRKISTLNYLMEMGLPKTNNWFDTIAIGMAEAYTMSLRDMNRYLSLLSDARCQIVGTNGRFSGDAVSSFMRAALIPVVFSMAVVAPDELKQIVNRLNVVPLYEAFLLCNEAISYLDLTLNHLKGVEDAQSASEDESAAERKHFLENLIYQIWCMDKYNNRRMQAYHETGLFDLDLNSFRALLKVIV